MCIWVVGRAEVCVGGRGRSGTADAIVGVTLFQDVCPAAFGRFSTAFVALFLATAGRDPPLPAPQPAHAGGGAGAGAPLAPWPQLVFMGSYYMVVNWMLLQVGPSCPPCLSPDTLRRCHHTQLASMPYKGRQKAGILRRG
jgi:hypothetical protein